MERKALGVRAGSARTCIAGVDHVAELAWVTHTTARGVGPQGASTLAGSVASALSTDVRGGQWSSYLDWSFCCGGRRRICHTQSKKGEEEATQPTARLGRNFVMFQDRHMHHDMQTLKTDTDRVTRGQLPSFPHLVLWVLGDRCCVASSVKKSTIKEAVTGPIRGEMNVSAWYLYDDWYFPVVAFASPSSWC